MLGEIRKFLNEERIYALMLVFVIIFFVLVHVKGRAKVYAPEAPGVKKLIELGDEEVKAILKEKGPLGFLFSLVSFAVAMAFLIGLILFLRFSYLFFSKRRGFFAARAELARPWDLFDVARISIIFLFLTQILILLQSAISPIFKAIKDDSFRALLNTTILDGLVLFLIIYFVTRKYKEKISSLGITVVGGLKGIVIGITGYLATLPALLGSLVMVNLLSKLCGYTPKPEPVVVLLLKETRPLFLFYLVFFITVAGPIVEEIFFRGFLYPALRKRMNLLWAMAISAVSFGLLHTNVIGLLPITILGLLLAYLYERTGSLISSMAVHVLHNSALLLLVFLLRTLAG